MLEQLRQIIPSGEPARPYSRRILHLSKDCEIMLAQWAPGMECAPHDHGSSGGFVHFLKGDFVEKHYELKDGVLRETTSRQIAAGEIVKVQPGEIHSCFSRDGGTTLHIYTPPIDGMRVFDIVNKQILTVHSSAGAWLPQPEELILSRE
jgi:predicted metal-dependent enzyme (double-stranded beta helix superfamily)